MRASLHSLCFLPVFLLSLVAPGKSQAPASSGAPSLPGDPHEFMLLAAKSNGLTGSDMQPWHLRATFQLLDDAGNVTDSGVYEEFWANPKKFKITFTGKSFTRIDYGTEKGILRSRTSTPLPDLVEEIRREFAEPLPRQESIDHESITLKQIDSNGSKLGCLRISSIAFDPGLTYCLGPDQPILRISAYARQSIQVLHNRILAFHGRFVAGDLTFLHDGKHVLSAHLESIQALSPTDETGFAPPADAILVPEKIFLSESNTVSLLLRKTTPIYPYRAKAARISGTVVLQALIGKKGYVIDLRVISGPPELQEAAIAAVRTWVYRPYLLNGEPFEFTTTIHVIFTIG